MLRFLTTTTPDGRTIVGVGLTEENVTRMREGRPVYMKLRDLKPEGPADAVEFLVYLGKDEESLVRELEEAGLVDETTEQHFDHRLGFH